MEEPLRASKILQVHARKKHHHLVPMPSKSCSIAIFIASDSTSIIADNPSNIPQPPLSQPPPHFLMGAMVAVAGQGNGVVFHHKAHPGHIILVAVVNTSIVIVAVAIAISVAIAVSIAVAAAIVASAAAFS
jgi:hypothetical protein